jgi:ubiquinone/menaquinone biosynthesis C-methylase UbiE
MRLYIFIGLVILLVGMVFMGVYYHIINNYFVVGDTIVYDLFFTFIQTVSSNNFFMNYGLWDDTANTMILANQNLANFIFEKAGLGSDRDNLAILDVGCGYGEQDLLWSGKMKKTCKITAVDISSTQITSANQRRLKRNILEENLEFVQGDAMRLEFAENTFDTVLSLESAFHYPDRPLFFKNVYSLLKPDGVFAIGDIVIDNECKRDIFTNLFIRVFSDFLHIPKTNLITANQWRDQIESTGLNVVEYHDITSNTFVPYYKHFFYNYIENKKWPTWVARRINNIFVKLQPFSYIVAVCRKPV